ncbi:MAG: discoidin domain-containing protein, partial [Flavobacterium sp.]
MKKNYPNCFVNNNALLVKPLKSIYFTKIKALFFIFLFFSSFIVTYAQSCNVVKGGDFTGGISNNWTSQIQATGWYSYNNQAYIEKDGVTNVSLKQSLTGLIGNSLTLTFKIRGQNAGRSSANCLTNAELEIKLGGTTYMIINNPSGNSQIKTTDISTSNGASYTQNSFPLTVAGPDESAMSQGTITLTIPWVSKPLTADLEFVATTSNAPNNGCASWGGDDWYLDDISVVASSPTIYTMNDSSVCEGNTATISLNSSQLGVYYELRRGTTLVQTINGTGNALSFTNQTATGTYRIVAVLNGTPTCTTSMNGSVIIKPNDTVGAASSSPIVCFGSALTKVTHTTTGVTGIGTATGLPAGITTNWESNVITISGTPTASGIFNYSIPLKGGCGAVNATGRITVNSLASITLNKTNETCPESNNGSITPSLSGGLTNVRYIKLTQKYINGDAWQQVAEIQAFEVFSGTNVALQSNGASAVSSTNYDSNTGPEKAIDGNVQTMWHSGTPKIDEFIKVDLASGKNLDYIRIYNRQNGYRERGQNMLLELFDASNVIIYSKNVDLYNNVNAPYYIDVNVLDLSWTGGGANTLNRTGLHSGTYTFNYSDATGCTNSSKNAIITSALNPSRPVLATPTQPTCSVLTGSVVLSGLPATGTIVQTGTFNKNINIDVTTGTQTIKGLAAGTYTFAVSNGSCSSPVTTNVVINAPPALVTWNGTAWSSTPTIENRVEFNENYSSPSSIEACSCYVKNNAVVTFNPGHTLKVVNEVVVNQEPGSTAKLTFENNASLVQVNDLANNSGLITYKRITVAVNRYDYTYWSSPVEGMTLHKLSPNTFFDKYYRYNNGWVISKYGVDSMIAGNGYIIRAPQSTAISGTPLPYAGEFNGKPNNGVIMIPLKGDETYLLGNPYPSALNADAFLTQNKDKLEGTLYFWTHNTAPKILNPGDKTYKYIASDYASYNRTGGVGTITSKAAVSIGVSSNVLPSGNIAAGQGFFAPATKSAIGNVVFNNSMRLGSGGSVLSNSQFFKLSNSSKTTIVAKAVEKSRIWLNLSNKEGAFKQTLVGYIAEATNDYDAGFDGVSYNGNQYLDFYSVNQDKNLTIQGRALPFVQKDTGALGYKSTIKGEFEITIDQTDGVLASQNVFLEDAIDF